MNPKLQTVTRQTGLVLWHKHWTAEVIFLLIILILSLTPSVPTYATSQKSATKGVAATIEYGNCQSSYIFQDVYSSDYYYDGVSYLGCRAVVSGYSDGTFRPYNYVTRSQLAKMVALAYPHDLLTYSSQEFSDVPTSNNFFQFVENAYHWGLMDLADCTSGNFCPYTNASRKTIARAGVQLAEYPLVNAPYPHFSDVPTSNAYYQIIETAYARGIISGYSDGTFKPDSPTTRGQVAKILTNSGLYHLKPWLGSNNYQWQYYGDYLPSPGARTIPMGAFKGTPDSANSNSHRFLIKGYHIGFSDAARFELDARWRCSAIEGYCSRTQLPALIFRAAQLNAQGSCHAGSWSGASTNLPTSTAPTIDTNCMLIWTYNTRGNIADPWQLQTLPEQYTVSAYWTSTSSDTAAVRFFNSEYSFWYGLDFGDLGYGDELSEVCLYNGSVPATNPDRLTACPF